MNVSHQIWGNFEHYFFMYSFCPFLSLLSSHYLYLWQLLVSHISLKLCLVLFIIFSFCSSDWIMAVDLSSSSPILSSASSNLLLSPCNEFFIPIIVLFNSSIFIWFFLIFLYRCSFFNETPCSCFLFFLRHDFF